jgi:hypothetical protein
LGGNHFLSLASCLVIAAAKALLHGRCEDAQY